MRVRHALLAAVALVAACALDIAVADDALDEQLISLSNLNATNVGERCAELEDALNGRDVCSELADAIDQVTAGGANLVPDGSLCADYKPYDPPVEDADTLAYLEEAIATNPVPCFLAFNSACEISYDDSLEAIAAFTNWMVTYSTVYNLLASGDETDIAPSCLAVLSPSDINELLGYQAAQEVQPYDGPGVDKNTPMAVDWRALGFVTPVTSQSGGTCYAHATFNWAGSMALLYNVTDLSGRNHMSSDTILSPQAYLDCLPEEACEGGSPATTLPWLVANPTPANTRYPYTTREEAQAHNASCRIPANPQCTLYTDNSTLLFTLPDEINTTEAQYAPVKMSESQIVQALATKGPLVTSISVGDLMFYWVPSSNGTLQPMNGNLEEAAANPDKKLLCAATGINHAVLLTGYNMQERWFQFKNSWGTNIGDQGYYYTRMSDPQSDNFTSIEYDSVCGLNAQVFMWTDSSPPPAVAISAPVKSAAVSG